MKPIRRHRKFEKNFKIRISPYPKLKQQFALRLELFMNGVRAFSIGGDLRVVYRETDEHYEFLDIGSHNQVY